MQNNMDELHRNLGQLEELMGIKGATLYKLCVPTGAPFRLKLDRLCGFQHLLAVPWMVLLGTGAARGTVLGGRFFPLKGAVRKGFMF